MFYDNPSISPPHQESPMNLLISPFEPMSSQYPGNHNENSNSNTTQPLDVPMQQSNHDLMNLYDTSGMSPIALSDNMSKPTFHNSLPSPHIEMMGNFANDFISRSPESPSSTESNMVSPPQQYYQSAEYPDFIWQDAMMQQAPPVPQQRPHKHHHHHHSSSKRSASVPPHFNKFKPHVQDTMYNQFQVTPSLHQQHHLKALPIQIQRVNAHTQSSQPVDVETLRRKLDEKLEKVNFEDITVAELKEMLRERGLSATGRKAELMSRLKEEYELLMSKGGAARAAAAVTTCGLSPTLSASCSLQRRVANMNLGSPKKQHTRLFSPYSPPQQPTRHASKYASSLPDSHTSSYLNDQFMMTRKPSSLRKSIDQEEQEHRDWIHSQSASPIRYNNLLYPAFEENNHSFNTAPLDIWDDQTLQNFLNEI